MQEIRRIGAGAFDGCHSLREAIIGEKCTSLGKEAFADCARYSQTLAMFGGLTEIGQGAFSGCTYLKSMWIPSQLREIPDECFAGCTSLRSVVVLAGAELETIGNKAFAGCTSLEELMNFALLPAMRKIGAGAFYDCTALRELPLHPEAKIVSLGEGAFKKLCFTAKRRSGTYSDYCTASGSVCGVYFHGNAAFAGESYRDQKPRGGGL